MASRLIDAYWQTLTPTPEEELDARLALRRESRLKRSEPARKGHSTRLTRAMEQARKMWGLG